MPRPDSNGKVAKVAYVKSQGQTRDHKCHWPGCNKQVAPAMWGCYSCWMKLPKSLRDKIWATFKPGQEVNGTPSREYVKVAREVQMWIADNYMPPKGIEQIKDKLRNKRHVILTPQTCNLPHDDKMTCPVCDDGLSVCSVCGEYEAGLDAPCVPIEKLALTNDERDNRTELDVEPYEMDGYGSLGSDAEPIGGTVPYAMVLRKVISGGQNGVDQAGLAAAYIEGFKTGGTMPKGFITLDGPRSDLAKLYGLEEHDRLDYPSRTFKNVKDSDGTIRLFFDPDSPGERLTLRAINQYRKPYIDVNLGSPQDPEVVVDWIVQQNIKTVNIAGNSERTKRGIFELARDYLQKVFQGVNLLYVGDDIVYLGSAPANEECAQTGQPDYPEASKEECLAYIQAIKRVCGEPPEGAVLRVKSESHDFGTYREVVCEFDGRNQSAAEYADKCDRHSPGTWAEAEMEAPVKRIDGIASSVSYDPPIDASPLLQEECAGGSEKLAVNIPDCDYIPAVFREAMGLSKKVDLAKPTLVYRNKNKSEEDEYGFVFTCPLLEAALLCDMIRSRDRKAGVVPTRLYIFRRTWQKIPNSVVLTETVDGKARLSRKVFKIEVVKAVWVPKKPVSLI